MIWSCEGLVPALLTLTQAGSRGAFIPIINYMVGIDRPAGTVRAGCLSLFSAEAYGDPPMFSRGSFLQSLTSYKTPEALPAFSVSREP